MGLTCSACDRYEPDSIRPKSGLGRCKAKRMTRRKTEEDWVVLPILINKSHRVIHNIRMDTWPNNPKCIAFEEAK